MDSRLTNPQDISTGRDGRKEASVADYLKSAILNGRFVAGQRLVESEITANLGVSRGPVREALRRLSAEGLVEIIPNRGAMVRRLSMTEALELFDIRTELEALAARRAAGNMQLPRVREEFDRMTAQIWNMEPRHSTADYLQENQRFHAAVIAASGNSQLVKLNQQLHLSLILAQISSSLSSPVIAASLHEHRVIASAIKAGDAEAAGEAIRVHLARAKDMMRAMPGDLFRQEDR